MSNSTRESAVSIALQSVKGTAATTGFRSLSLTAHSLNPMKRVQTLPPEIGGSAFARGAYASGYVVAGMIEGVVRLDDVGLLLYAYCGEVSSSKATNIGTHVFTMAANQFSQPWLTIRRRVGLSELVDEMIDCKIVSLDLLLPADGVLGFRAGVIGITSERDASATISAPTDTRFGVGCKGSIEIPTGTTTHKFLGGMVRLMSQTSGPQQEQAVGSYTMRDVTILGRSGMVNLTYLWDSRTLYDATLYDGAGVFDPTVYKNSITVKAVSPDIIPGGGTTPFSLSFAVDAASGAFASEPLELGGNNVTTMGLVGMILDKAGGEPFTITLVNGEVTTSYDGVAIP